jgi:hypothetical protein
MALGSGTLPVRSALIRDVDRPSGDEHTEETVGHVAGQSAHVRSG